MEYTNRWIQLVDRGGLFHISDEVYSFFYKAECLVRKFLFEIVQDTREHSKDEIIDDVACDSGIQFHWSTIAADLDEDASKMLLVEVVKLWLTIRGFSTAGAFVEQYKQTVKKSTKKTKGLLKGLKWKSLFAMTDGDEEFEDDELDNDA